MKIALIPARSGSKRLPKKNKINFLGKPLIEYSVLFAEKNNFDDIIISTDDEDLLNYAVKRGINYIQRPKKISLDTTPIYEVLKHMISEKNISNNSCYSNIVRVNGSMNEEGLIGLKPPESFKETRDWQGGCWFFPSTCLEKI